MKLNWTRIEGLRDLSVLKEVDSFVLTRDQMIATEEIDIEELSKAAYRAQLIINLYMTVMADVQDGLDVNVLRAIEDMR